VPRARVIRRFGDPLPSSLCRTGTQLRHPPIFSGNPSVFLPAILARPTHRACPRIVQVIISSSSTQHPNFPYSASASLTFSDCLGSGPNRLQPRGDPGETGRFLPPLACFRPRALAADRRALDLACLGCASPARSPTHLRPCRRPPLSDHSALQSAATIIAADQRGQRPRAVVIINGLASVARLRAARWCIAGGAPSCHSQPQPDAGQEKRGA